MKVKVLIDTLNHNGRRRAPGELIEIDDADAAQLIRAGAAEIAPEEKPAPFNPDGNQNPVSDSADASKTNTQEKPDDVDKSANDADEETSDKGKKESKSKAK